jgi:dTDP-4-amino-4,6-dideoxygalactose transaminase
MSDFIPIARVQLGQAEVDEVTATLRSGWLTTGPRTRDFEEKSRAYLGCAHALALNSGTAALHLACSALGLGPGDEVVTTPLTFAASVNAILYVGATPVLADVDAATLNLSPEAAAAAITPRTRAVLVVHYGGLPADLDAFSALARERGLALIEDAAHAMGARWRGRRVGQDAQAACFSFHPVKNMTSGEGGLLVTAADEVERLARLRSWHGIDKSALARFQQGGNWYYEVQELGFKYNMTDVQAAIGLHQLARLDAANEERRAIAREYDQAFGALPGVAVAPTVAEAEETRHLYWLVLDPEMYDRGRFIDALATRQIGSGVHYIPVHMHPYYRRRFGWSEGLCPRAERAFQGLVSIPIWQGMSAEQRARVAEAVPAALREVRR